MIKKIIGTFVLAGLLAVALPALAQDAAPAGSGSAPNTTAVKASKRNTVNAESIACVGAAVAVREAALSAAFTAHSSSMSAAYSTRANTLAGAYSNGTAKEVQRGVKVAWGGFKKSTRAAAGAWKKSKNEAWGAFRKAVKDCKAPGSIFDSSNSGSEPNGN